MRECGREEEIYTLARGPRTRVGGGGLVGGAGLEVVTSPSPSFLFLSLQCSMYTVHSTCECVYINALHEWFS